MMKWLISVVLIALLSFVSSLYLPWWSIAIMAALVAALIPQKPLSAFLAGFSAVLLLWTSIAGWLSVHNEHILARRMALLFFKSEQPFVLILITGLTGAMVAGLAALSGSFLAIKRNAVLLKKEGIGKKWPARSPVNAGG